MKQDNQQEDEEGINLIIKIYLVLWSCHFFETYIFRTLLINHDIVGIGCFLPSMLVVCLIWKKCSG